jgi:hypothetical protein
LLFQAAKVVFAFAVAKIDTFVEIQKYFPLFLSNFSLFSCFCSFSVGKIGFLA